MSSKILLRRGTAAEWLSANPILSNGEVGVETDTLKFKIGNGTSTWTQLLSYANVTPSTLSSSLSDYILSADLGVAGGPSKLNSSGNLIIPESSIILWNDDAYTYTTTLTATQPTANRAITLPNATGTVALVSDVTSAINNLINAAPSALDTLNELAAAINNDSSFSTTVNNLLTGKVSKSGGDTITSATASTKGLVIKGASSQTASLLEWQDSSGNLLGRFHPTAGLLIPGLSNTNGGAAPYINFNTTNFALYPNLASNVGLVIQGAASQTGDLQVWQDTYGNKLSYINAAGQFISNVAMAVLSGNYGGYVSYIQASNPSYKGILVKGAASQTANLQEWQNSAGSIYAKVDSSGNIYSRNNFQSLASDIYLIDSGGTAFRSVRAGAWADSVDTRFFQVGSSSDRIAFTAQNGTSATRIQFNSAYTTISNYFYGSTPAPSAILNVLTSADTLVLKVQGTSGQTANLQEWQDSSGNIRAFVNASGDIGTVYGSLQVGNGNAIKDSLAATPNITFGNNTITVWTRNSSYKGFIIQGVASQSANLQEWQNSSGTTLLSVSSDGTLNKTGTLNIGPVLSFADPGVGNETKFVFSKTSDSAWITVKERSSDNTYYEFGMSDNALDGGDYFQWTMAQWTALGMGWMPIQLGSSGGKSQTLRFTGEQSTFYSNLLVPLNSPFYTYLGDNYASSNYEVNKWIPSNSTSINLRRFESTGSSATFNVDLSGYTYSGRMGYKITIDSGATTFSYSTYGGDSSSGSAITITAGSWQTLSNGVKIKIGSGALAGENWSFLAFPTPRFAIGGTVDTSALAVIKPIATDKGLVIKGDTSQTANLQEWQDSAGTVVTKVTSSGNIDTTIQISGRSAVTAGTGNYLSASLSVIPLNASIIGAVIKAYPSQTANLQEWQNSAGATRTSILSDGSLFSNMYSTFTNAGAGGGNAIYVRTIYASDVPLAVRGAASQTANLQEWQNSSGTVLARVQSDGAFVSDYITTGQYLTSLNKLRAGGATSYGAQLEVTSTSATNIGAVIRAAASQSANLQEWQNSSGVKSVWIDPNGQLTTAYYFTNFGGGSVNLGLVTISGTGNIIPLAIRGVSGQTLNLQEWQNSSGTVLTYIRNDGLIGTSAGINATGNYTNSFGGTAISNVILAIKPLASNIGLAVRGAASQTANLQEWQDNSGTVLSKVDANGKMFANGLRLDGLDASNNSIYKTGTIGVLAGTNISLKLNQDNTGSGGSVFVQAAYSQTSDLMQWRDPNNNVLVSVTASGVLNAPLVTNAQTVSYTLVFADAGKMVEMNSASANTLTVPTNATVGYAIGTQINILQVGSGQTTVAGASGVTINAAPGLKLRTQWSSATLIKRATDTWVLVGDLSA